MAGRGWTMLLGDGRLITMDDGSGTVVMDGAGGPVLVYRPTCGVRPWLVSSDGEMAALAGLRSHHMKGFSPGGDAVCGAAVLARMDQTGPTVCGTWACGVRTEIQRSGAVLFLQAPMGSGDRAKGLVLPRANSLRVRASFTDRYW